MNPAFSQTVLGGSWVVISGVISRATIVITQIRGLITPLITAHEPPSVEGFCRTCLAAARSPRTEGPWRAEGLG